MATLEKLRNKAGFILIAFIGLALLSFILTDMFSTPQGGSMFGGNPNEVAKIGGKSVHIQEYQQLIREMEENHMRNTGRSSLDDRTRSQMIENAWELLVQQHVMNHVYEELGLAVSGEELFDLIQGNDPHPIIRNNFTNPETGELNRTQIVRFLKSMAESGDPQQRELWLPIEQQIYRQRKLSKYINLVQKGMYVNTIEAQQLANKNTMRFDVSYVQKRYDAIPNDEVELTDKDVKRHYKTYQNKYKQESSRTVEYVTFNVVPSASDVEVAREWIESIAPEFAEVEEIRQYVNLNSDEPYDRTNYARGELPEELDSALFDAELGTLYGPYREDEAFKIAKLAAINYVPDSVQARHILIQPSQQMNANQAREMADSLLNEIRSGASFAQVARANSADRGSAQDGGELGWFTEGMMVGPINDTAFYGNVGDISLVSTQFGFHILEIQDQSPKKKKVQVGIVVRNIAPRDVTYEKYYQEASEFAGTNRKHDAFKKAAEAKGLNIRTASGLKEMTQIVHNLQSPREMVKWAFTAGKNEVSNVFEFGDQFVVAALTDVKQEGVAPLEEVRSEIETELRRERKAEKIKQAFSEALASSSSISDVAAQHDLTVLNATGVTGSSRTLEGVGNEPGVIAVATTLDENVLSKPIAGRTGVYVISISNKLETPADPNMIRQQKFMIERTYTNRANFEAYEAVKDYTKIVDKRDRFY